MRLLQGKREAYWFYRVLSLVYERVNTLFWTPPMRARALELVRLDDRDLKVVDVGAGTGFTTEGVVERVDPGNVTMLDQSPHQFAVARRKPMLARIDKVLGDAEDLPFAEDSFDRYVSAGSIEYWPDPQRAIAEAYRVLRQDGVALVVGPLPPHNPIARWLADVWMLFPDETEYVRWFAKAGFAEVERLHLSPGWHRGKAGYAIAIAGRKPTPGPSPIAADSYLPTREPEPTGAMARARFIGRFIAGSLAGALFIPIAAALIVRDRLRGNR